MKARTENIRAVREKAGEKEMYFINTRLIRNYHSSEKTGKLLKADPPREEMFPLIVHMRTILIPQKVI